MHYCAVYASVLLHCTSKGQAQRAAARRQHMPIHAGCSIPRAAAALAALQLPRCTDPAGRCRLLLAAADLCNRCSSGRGIYTRLLLAAATVAAAAGLWRWLALANGRRLRLRGCAGFDGVPVASSAVVLSWLVACVDACPSAAATARCAALRAPTAVEALG
jgi:hypothetical protein